MILIGGFSISNIIEKCGKLNYFANIYCIFLQYI